MLINASIIYTQWIQQISGTPRSLLSIDMLDENTGYVCGDQIGRILKTTNGGTNWIGYNEPTGDQYNGISFINAFTGLAVGPPGLVLRTSNGGLNWNTVSQPGGDKGPVQFVSSNIAYAAGDDIIKSTNGGLTWFVIRNGTILSQYQGLYFIDENTGSVVGRPGLIITTTNGGSSWTQRIMYLPVQFGDSTLFDVFYVNSLIGYACGNNGIVIKTTNGGENWIYLPTGTLNALFGEFFINTNTGTIVGNVGRIMRTTDGGINWLYQVSPLNYLLEDVNFVNQNTGWIVGTNGLILKTTTGGVTWLQPISNEIPNKFNLQQNYPNPFNPNSKIKFQIPKSTIVKLVVYDVLGKEVQTLVNENLSPGTYEVSFDGSNLPSSVYFYRLDADEFTETKKLALLK
jgi:photosystem II stability/assembly factor-like uncharacterized protein